MTADITRVTADITRATALPVTTTVDWRRRYIERLRWTDTSIVALAVFGSEFLWREVNPQWLTLWSDNARVPSTVFSVSLVVSWVVVLGFFSTRDARTIGAGSAEYRSLIDASLRLLVVVLLIMFMLKWDLNRGPVFTAFFGGTGALILSRWIWRQWLGRQRENGRMMARVLLVGSVESVVHLGKELRRAVEAGYTVVGACVPDGTSSIQLERAGIPYLGDLDHVSRAMDAVDADTLVITSADALPPERVRQLSWNLVPGKQHLVVAPSLTDIGGPRIHIRPVSGLPLIHVETPQFGGRQGNTKRVFDVIASSILLAVFSPLLAAVAIGVRFGSEGGVLFRQTRVGLNGETFAMLKFRTMVKDAELTLDELKSQQRAVGNRVMFKMHNDPRITRLGRILRRYSLDELPQLWNVFLGDMSIIGPRPPLVQEVEQYETHVHRRFLMKPGITGLWQVSGRSNLSWEDSVRLDLYYVENWSITNDLLILWKTVRAVLMRDGAY